MVIVFKFFIYSFCIWGNRENKGKSHTKSPTYPSTQGWGTAAQYQSRVADFVLCFFLCQWPWISFYRETVSYSMNTCNKMNLLRNSVNWKQCLVMATMMYLNLLLWLPSTYTHVGTDTYNVCIDTYITLLVKCAILKQMYHWVCGTDLFNQGGKMIKAQIY